MTRILAKAARGATKRIGHAAERVARCGTGETLRRLSRSRATVAAGITTAIRAVGTLLRGIIVRGILVLGLAVHARLVAAAVLLAMTVVVLTVVVLVAAGAAASASSSTTTRATSGTSGVIEHGTVSPVAVAHAAHVGTTVLRILVAVAGAGIAVRIAGVVAMAGQML